MPQLTAAHTTHTPGRRRPHDGGRQVSGSLEEARFADAIEAAAFMDLYAAAPLALASALGLRAAEAGGATLLHAPGIPQSMFNRAIGFGSRQPADESALDEVIAAFDATGYAGYWIHHNPVTAPPSVAEWLERRGFRLPARRSWAKMVRETGDLPQTAVRFELRQAQPREAEDVAQVVCSAFGMPGPFLPWIAALATRPGWRAYAAFDGARVAGAGYLFIDGPGAWLGMGGVLPAARGQGVHRGLMALRVRAASEAGCTRVATETGEPVGDEPNPSLANMQRCGFRQVASRLNFTRAG